MRTPLLLSFLFFGSVVFGQSIPKAPIQASQKATQQQQQLDYQKATYDGNGLTYLWFRVPLQILFILWAFVSRLLI